MPPIVPPAGISPAALFVPAVFVSPQTPPQVLAWKLDPTSGELLSLFEGRPSVVALLIEQLRVVRGSGASVQDSGNALSTIRYNDDAAPARIDAEMHRILDPLVAADQIALLKLDVDAGPSSGDTGEVFARFRDLVSPVGGPGATYTLKRTDDGSLSLSPDSPDTSP